MGISSQVPPDPMTIDAEYSEIRELRRLLPPPPPLPWIYRDPQRWLLPSLILVAIAIAGALSL